MPGSRTGRPLLRLAVKESRIPDSGHQLVRVVVEADLERYPDRLRVQSDGLFEYVDDDHLTGEMLTAADGPVKGHFLVEVDDPVASSRDLLHDPRTLDDRRPDPLAR